MIANERNGLRLAVLILALVPILAGLDGVLRGSGMTGGVFDDISLDSHVRYLSGILLCIGLGFWSTLPRIETQGERFMILTALVFTGGLARLYAVVIHGLPSGGMIFGLGMELVVTPLLYAWQRRVAFKTVDTN